jgi:hypothetical protein
MRILIGAMLLLLEIGALACTLKALGETTERGSFVSTLFLGGMAGKERFTTMGWKWRNRAMLLQSLAVLTLIAFALTRH